MKIRLLVIGKTSSKALVELELTYQNRLSHYLTYERVELPDVKQAASFTPEQLKEKEASLFLTKISSDHHVILLDENGHEFSSESFARLLSNHCLHSSKTLTFCIGGAFGFAPSMYERANAKLALSKMTFSHQMVRTIFLEQLYRACTINKGEKYHHS